jgi:hexosaminidase
VVPAIREWQGGSGALALTVRSRIVVESRELSGEAELLRDDLEAITGLDLRVRRDARARDGDLVLERRRGLGPEGYELEIHDRVTIAGEDAGVFYGTQTVLQMLRSTAGHRTLPRGEARERPRFRERGYMLDAGRKYWSPDYVVQTIREMAYLKLNTLQLPEPQSAEDPGAARAAGVGAAR